MIAVVTTPLSTSLHRTFLAIFSQSTDERSGVYTCFHTPVDAKNCPISMPYYTVHGVHTNIINRAKWDNNRVYRKRRAHSWTGVDRGRK